MCKKTKKGSLSFVNVGTKPTWYVPEFSWVILAFTANLLSSGGVGYSRQKVYEINKNKKILAHKWHLVAHTDRIMEHILQNRPSWIIHDSFVSLPPIYPNEIKFHLRFQANNREAWLNLNESLLERIDRYSFNNKALPFNWILYSPIIDYHAKTILTIKCNFHLS